MGSRLKARTSSGSAASSVVCSTLTSSEIPDCTPRNGLESGGFAMSGCRATRRSPIAAVICRRGIVETFQCSVESPLAQRLGVRSPRDRRHDSCSGFCTCFRINRAATSASGPAGRSSPSSLRSTVGGQRRRQQLLGRGSWEQDIEALVDSVPARPLQGVVEPGPLRQGPFVPSGRRPHRRRPDPRRRRQAELRRATIGPSSIAAVAGARTMERVAAEQP